MPKKKKISVIVPIYNREKELGQAVDSLIGQTHQNLDIILVDDGSTDSSPRICEQYAARDERIRVIRQPNSGSGHARNTGLAAAVGDYVAFLESDDWLAPEMYASMLRRAEETKADIVKTSFWRVIDENHSLRRENRWDALAEKWGDAPFSIRDEPRIANIHASIWASLYLMDCIKNNNLRFIVTPKATYSDRSWMPQTYAAAKRISIINEPLYFYRKMKNHVQSGNRTDEKCLYMPYHCIEARKIYKKFGVHDYVLEYDYKHSYICGMHYFKQIRPDLRDQYFTLFHEVMKNVHNDGLQYQEFSNNEKVFTQLIADNKKDDVYSLLGFGNAEC